MTIPIIINRNARGLGVASDLPRRFGSIAGCRVVETRTLEELEAAARALATERAPIVALAGGDGSVMAGLSALARAWRDANAERPLPRVAILPAGTFSTIAKNLEIPRQTLPHAVRVLEDTVAHRATLRTHATLRVRDGAGGDRLGFIFGTGLVAQFFELYDAMPDKGAVSAAALVGKLFVGSFSGSELAETVLTPVPLRLAADGEALSYAKYSLVVSSVLRDVGLHVRPTRRAGEDPERIHLVASTRHATNLALQLPRVLAARPMRGSGHVDRLVKNFKVTFDGTLRSYVLDGDRIDAGKNGGDAWALVERGPDVELLYAA